MDQNQRERIYATLHEEVAGRILQLQKQNPS